MWGVGPTFFVCCLPVVCPLFDFVAVFALFDIYIETIHVYILYSGANGANWSNRSNLGKSWWLSVAFPFFFFWFLRGLRWLGWGCEAVDHVV